MSAKQIRHFYAVEYEVGRHTPNRVSILRFRTVEERDAACARNTLVDPTHVRDSRVQRALRWQREGRGKWEGDGAGWRMRI